MVNQSANQTNQPAATSQGWVTFVVKRTDGSFTEISIYFPPAVWSAMKAQQWFVDKYGLNSPVNQGVPVVPAGQLENFRLDMRQALPPELHAVADEKMATASTVAGDPPKDEDEPPPPVSDKMAESGIQWSRDPVTRKWVLIDTLPLVGPKLSSWQWIVRDPNNPNDGEWKMTVDPSDTRAMFEGVPDAVRPWLQAALDNGGDATVAPAGPMRSWVEFVLGQARGSSRRQPGDMPFGVGLPEFRPTAPSQGQPTLTTPPGQTPRPGSPGSAGGGAGGTSPSGSGIPPHGPNVSETSAIIVDRLFAGSKFKPVYGVNAFAGQGEYNFDGTASMLDMLMSGGAVGLAQGIENSDTPLGHMLRELAKAGMIDLRTNAEILGADFAKHDAQNRASGGQGINPNATQITWKGPVNRQDGIPGVSKIRIPGELGGDPRPETTTTTSPGAGAGVADVPRDQDPNVRQAGGVGGAYNINNPAAAAQQRQIDRDPNSLGARVAAWNLGQGDPNAFPGTYAPGVRPPPIAGFGDSEYGGRGTPTMADWMAGRTTPSGAPDTGQVINGVYYPAGTPQFVIDSVRGGAPPASSEGPPAPPSGGSTTTQGTYLPPGTPSYVQQATGAAPPPPPAPSAPAPQRVPSTQEINTYMSLLSTAGMGIADEYLRQQGYS